MKTILLYIVLIAAFFSCNSEQKEKEQQIAQLVNEWQGKQIVFPENAIFTRYLTDTTDFQIPQSDYKIIIYVDSTGCTSCKLKPAKWKELIQHFDSVTQEEIPFLFFFHPKDIEKLHNTLIIENFDYPVCIDLNDQLNKLNLFPTDIAFHTFLLDKNNKVIVLGNPIANPAIKDLYLKQITGKENPNKDIPKTRAEASQTDIDFGTFNKSEVKEITIEVKNTGNNPLVIVDINTTCGCTAATYDKRPAKPGESLQVGIKMTPKDTGFFDEVVTIKYNSTNNQPVKMKIKGNAK
ncbi:DUF1573 domain-containing protein [Parabacteroides chongii]|uniref:DUF1573 domain-containing protein n=1 Tax=Parabacteroides chongii TaxID=2685834 RepID=UPI00240DF14F|nr:DUF1573 domain-containing protein [Parabacteroides chongii]WFE86599.1 DUF1573 domain-containing protein [Parabacteroides chongii]